MRSILIFLAVLGGLTPLTHGQAPELHLQRTGDSTFIRAIYDEALARGEAHENLRQLTKDIGHRLSGSQTAFDAMHWGQGVLERYGADSVWVMPVMVPSWTRGTVAQATSIINGEEHPLHVTALGGSVGTPNEQPLRARLVHVKSLEQLSQFPPDEVEGRLVLFNRPMDPVLINTGAAYGGAVDQRGRGAIAAAKAGAIGALVRSMTHALDTLPHTGAMYYEEGIDSVPSAAISTVDASWLANQLKGNPDLEVSL